MVQKNIIVAKTARYFVLGQPSGNIEEVWFVCHGYGELAPYFLKKFELLDNGKRLIVAPEALNRFYRQGFSGKVGASWMTKEERESEISDYVNFLQSVYLEVMSSLKVNSVSVNVLGFSQATATVCRWLINKKITIDNLILWAGFFPHDLNFEVDKEYFNSINCFLVMGKEDEFYGDKEIQDKLKDISAKGIQYQFHYFNGKHEIQIEKLKEIMKY